MLRFKNLGSGSSGNATIIQARGGTSITHLLVDCGLGIRQLDKRLGQAGMLAEQIDAIFITHEHADHIGCARQFALRERIPIWMSHGTYTAMGEPDFNGLLRIAYDTQPIEIGALRVMPFTVPHDAREPLQLTCTDGDERLGVLTDLGHATSHVLEQLSGCGSVLLECNHDPQMLAASTYPPFLKRRVGGAYGHLANEAAAAIAQSIQGAGLKQVVAAHLSEQNNRPDLARAALAAALGCGITDILVADAANGSGWLAC
ncbi:MBL fold metallo-hydrolase [Ramlibacter sp. WS9]|uniref:MBL fold metallo-hydrolase n=1 Tax=Ramlibacter sp. WS9 TaxID=1882741 RepID=UPI001142D4D2|nr:MBL fold metallo-hydrolase [Ramlibacter sp. WS9]ROZ64145.1 MBL fold metallo-hydrolase [Ramlibacter sp. WS9]